MRVMRHEEECHKPFPIFLDGNDFDDDGSGVHGLVLYSQRVKVSSSDRMWSGGVAEGPATRLTHSFSIGLNF